MGATEMARTMKSRQRAGLKAMPLARGLRLATSPRTCAISTATPSTPVARNTVSPNYISPSDKYPAQAHALVALLQNSIQFVPATNLTFEDDAKMAVLRPRKVVRGNETQRQNTRRRATEHISNKWGTKSTPPLPSRGMDNPSQLCYRNAVLQALLHTPKFVNWLEQAHPTCTVPPTRHCVACALHAVSVAYWGQGNVRRALTNFQNVAWRAGWQHDGQQDSHDFYIWLVAKLREQLSQESRVLISMLTIETKSIIRCPRCKRLSTTHGPTEPSFGVNPPANRSSHLIDLVRATFSRDILSDVRCGDATCKHTSNRPRTQCITAAPDLLCIQVRRFYHDFRSGGTSRPRKNSQRVVFGERIDLSAYLEGQQLRTRGLQYRLVAAVHQIGALNSGHYICVARGPNGQWRELNDDVVRRVRREDATDPQGKGKNRSELTPYLLFWERVEREVADQAAISDWNFLE